MDFDTIAILWKFCRIFAILFIPHSTKQPFPSKLQVASSDMKEWQKSHHSTSTHKHLSLLLILLITNMVALIYIVKQNTNTVGHSFKMYNLVNNFNVVLE